MSSEHNRLELCRYRLQQAYEALDEAKLLLEAGHLRGAINRSYYAMFYALQVLVIQNMAKVSKHSGVISYFDREFVKPGVIDQKFSKWLHRLFDLRQDADYGDMFTPTEKQTNDAFAQAKEFVQRIEAYHEEYSSE